MSYSDVSLVDEYKVVVHFPDYDQNYRLLADNEAEAQLVSDSYCGLAQGESWSLYRALGEHYMGQGTIGPDGSRTPMWCYNVIGWRAIRTTRTYRNIN